MTHRPPARLAREPRPPGIVISRRHIGPTGGVFLPATPRARSVLDVEFLPDRERDFSSTVETVKRNRIHEREFFKDISQLICSYGIKDDAIGGASNTRLSRRRKIAHAEIYSSSSICQEQRRAFPPRGEGRRRERYFPPPALGPATLQGFTSVMATGPSSCSWQDA